MLVSAVTAVLALASPVAALQNSSDTAGTWVGSYILLERQQCKWEGVDALQCAEGLVCAVESDAYGECRTLQAALWDQCGGLNWITGCQPGSMCEAKNGNFSWCVPTEEDDVPLWGRCRWGNGEEATCESGLVCVTDVEYYGLCYHNVAPVTEQCGGWGWTVGCESGSTCVRLNDAWATCEESSETTVKLAEWQRCKWTDRKADCADGLVCVDDSDAHGLCVKAVAEHWGQCGGYGWTTECIAGSKCELRSDAYRQCVPDISH